MDERRDLRQKLGISRRDLLRRGAIVGGTLVWTVPVIESISKHALAAKGSYHYFCCFCTKANQTTIGKCVASGRDIDIETPGACQSTCAETYADQGFTTGHFKHSSRPLSCSDHGGCHAA
jgi:hypothetical protein